jgi:hypothetical protein
VKSVPWAGEGRNPAGFYYNQNGQIRRICTTTCPKGKFHTPQAYFTPQVFHAPLAVHFTANLGLAQSDKPKFAISPYYLLRSCFSLNFSKKFPISLAYFAKM